MTLEIGSPAPEFTVKATMDIHGNAHTEGDKHITLSELRGKKVVLFFYPKDSTPGCTIESCGFNEHLSDFQNENTVILGVSKDSLKSHDKFAAKHDFKYPLLADDEIVLCNLYEVYVDKSMFGKKYKGIERSTFLINEAGNIIEIWRKVKVAGHVSKVLDTVKTSEPVTN